MSAFSLSPHTASSAPKTMTGFSYTTYALSPLPRLDTHLGMNLYDAFEGYLSLVKLLVKGLNPVNQRTMNELLDKFHQATWNWERVRGLPLDEIPSFAGELLAHVELFAEHAHPIMCSSAVAWSLLNHGTTSLRILLRAVGNQTESEVVEHLRTELCGLKEEQRSTEQLFAQYTSERRAQLQAVAIAEGKLEALEVELSAVRDENSALQHALLVKDDVLPSKASASTDGCGPGCYDNLATKYNVSRRAELESAVRGLQHTVSDAHAHTLALEKRIFDQLTQFNATGDVLLVQVAAAHMAELFETVKSANMKALDVIDELNIVEFAQ